MASRLRAKRARRRLRRAHRRRRVLRAPAGHRRAARGGAVAQKLIHELGKPYRVGSHELSSGASIGIACVPQDGDDVNRLLRLADHAMYRAKEPGRNGYQFFSALLNDNVEAAAELAEELRAAVERGELFLAYQPRFDIATRQVAGAEALLRWRHPRHGVSRLRLSCISPMTWGPFRRARRLDPARSPPAGPALNRGQYPLLLDGRQHERAAASAAQASPTRCARRSRRAVRPPKPLHRSARDRGTPARRVGRARFAEITASGACPQRRRLRHRLRIATHASKRAREPRCIDCSLIAGVPDDLWRAGLVRALIALARGLDFEVGRRAPRPRRSASSSPRRAAASANSRPQAEVEPFLRSARAHCRRDVNFEEWRHSMAKLKNRAYVYRQTPRR